MQKKIILFELNEVPVRILDYYTAARPHSWLAQSKNKRRSYETYMPNRGHLSPWNTWPSFHRGVSNEKHFLSDFNQDLTEVDKEFPPIWKKLADNGVSVGVFGSLHSYPLPEERRNVKFHVPDVFAPSGECIPDNVSIFQEINLALSRESARNVNGRVPVGEAAQLALKFRHLGFRFSTVTDVMGQILSERFDKWKTTRRRTYQTVIGFDVFYKLLQQQKPDFTTFFTNHVASSMHRYWAAAFPKDYSDFKFSDDWVKTYDDEILWTMDKADRMLSTLASFVDQHPEYILVCASSMGQHAVECEPTETQLYVKNHEKFMNCLGLDSSQFEILPAMVPQFNYRISEGALSGFRSTLELSLLNGEPLSFREADNGFVSIDLGQRNLSEVDLSVAGKHFGLAETGLENTVIEDMSSASAYHIPEGHMWVYHPSYEEARSSIGQINALDFFQSTLQNFGKNSNSQAPTLFD